jgi:hypothetical protein
VVLLKALVQEFHWLNRGVMTILHRFLFDLGEHTKPLFKQIK